MKVACFWFSKPAPTALMAELFLRFSPQICILKQKALFVEIGKCENLYSTESFLARAGIILKRQNQTARIRIGQDVTDALALAKFDASSVGALPLEALLDFADPFERDEALRKAVLKMIDSFHDLGIKNLADFKKIPTGQLLSRFGVVGRHCHSRVHSTDFISWPLWVPEEIISQKKDFQVGFYGEMESILFELKSQLDQIFARTFARKKKVLKLKIEIKCEKISTHPNFLRTLTFDFFAPQGSSKGTLRIVKERLAREFEKAPIRSPIESLETQVLKMIDFEGGQKNIFNDDEDKFEQINSVHNQLIELLGSENVFQAQLTEDRRPERSWKKKFDSPHHPCENGIQITDRIPERSTYLCRYPIKVEVTAGFIHINKKRYQILYWDNQIEKINGGWFEKPVSEIQNTFDRSYSFVEIEGHQKLSVFQTPDRQFYLHGYYG